MDNGIQAVTARIAQLEQRFVAGGESSADTQAASTSNFASVLAAALGGESSGAAGLGADVLGNSALTGGVSTSSLTGTSGTGVTNALASLLGNPATLASLLAGLSGTTTGSGYGATSGYGSSIGAISSTSNTGRTPAVKSATGSYPKLTPPAELVAFGNGRIPTDRLESIGVGSHKLYAPAAQAYRQMTADAKAQGVTIGITDSYRTYDSQVDLAGRKGLYSQGGLAATPGTSNHGWGLAVDLDLDPTAQQWMRDNAANYGFVEDTPREPWHWGYRPAATSTAI